MLGIQLLLHHFVSDKNILTTEHECVNVYELPQHLVDSHGSNTMKPNDYTDPLTFLRAPLWDWHYGLNTQQPLKKCHEMHVTTLNMVDITPAHCQYVNIAILTMLACS